MTRTLFAALGLCIALAGAAEARAATTYYVSAANGQDNFPGTSAMPFLTIQKAADVAVAGDTVVVRAGTYVGAKLSHSGTLAAPITFTAEPGAIVASPGP